MTGRALSCLPRSRAAQTARGAARLEVIWQSQGCPQRRQGRGQGMWRGEEERGAGAFPAWQDEGCGPAGPVPPSQALCHKGSWVCTAKGCSCPVCDPGLTLLSPSRDSLSSATVTVWPNINPCPPHSAKGSTESSPFAAPGPQLQCVHMSIPKQKHLVALSNVPQPGGSRRRGVAQDSAAVLLVGGDMAAISHSRTVPCPRSDVQGRW